MKGEESVREESLGVWARMGDEEGINRRGRGGHGEKEGLPQKAQKGKECGSLEVWEEKTCGSLGVWEFESRRRVGGE